MNKKMKTILALLLSTAMLLTAMPFSVATELPSPLTAAAEEPLGFESMTLIAESSFPISAPTRMNIAVMADTHLFTACQAGFYNQGWGQFVETSGARMLVQSENILRAALRTIEETYPPIEYLLVAGDITREGERSGHVMLREIFTDFWERTGIRVLIAPGNHDVNAYRGIRFDAYSSMFERSIEAPEFWDFYAHLWEDMNGFERFVPTPVWYPGSNRHNSRLRPPGYYAEAAGYLSFGVDMGEADANGRGAFRLLVLDAVRHSPDVNPDGFAYQTGGEVSPELLEWALRQANEAVMRGQIPLVMIHHTLGAALPGPFEGRGMNANFTVRTGQVIAELLADAGVRFAFTAHAHTHAVTRLVSDSGNVIYDISLGSLINYPATYRDVELIAQARDDIIANVTMRYSDESGPIPRRLQNTDGSLPTLTEVVYVGYYGDGGPGDRAPFRGAPFAITSLALSYNFADMNAFALEFVEVFLMPIYRAGGLADYLETLGMNVETLVATAIGGAQPNFIARGIARNINNFVQSIFDQLDHFFFTGLAEDGGRNAEGTLAVLGELLDLLLHLEISQHPSERFFERYGVGDPSAPGTLASLIGEGLIYQYGRQDCAPSNLFVQDVIARAESGELLQQALDDVLPPVIDLLETEILDVLELRFAPLFLSSLMQATFGRAFDGIFCFLFGGHTLSDIISRVLGIANVLRIIPSNDLRGTLDFVIETVLTDQAREAVNFLLVEMITGFVTDVDDVPDLCVVLHYTGPRTPVATQKNGRLPTAFVQQLPTAADDFCRVFSWYTRASVDGTHIRVWNEHGVEVTGNLEVSTRRELLEREVYAFDLGIIGLNPLPAYFNRHRVEISGLRANASYTFQAGDATRDWWTPVGELNTSGVGEGFLVFGDQGNMTPLQYANSWGRLSAAAAQAFPDAAFAVSAGSRVTNVGNIDQWQWFFDSGQETLVNLPLMPVVVAAERNAMRDFFPLQQGSYTFTHGDMFVMVFDGSSPNIRNLRRAIQNSGTQFSVVVLRQAPSNLTRRQLNSAGADLIIHNGLYCPASFGAVTVENNRLRHTIWNMNSDGAISTGT